MRPMLVPQKQTYTKSTSDGWPNHAKPSITIGLVIVWPTAATAAVKPLLAWFWTVAKDKVELAFFECFSGGFISPLNIFFY